MAIETIFGLIIGGLIAFLSTTVKDYINDKRKKEQEKKELSLKRLDEAFFYLSKIYSQTNKIFTSIMEDKESIDTTKEASSLSFIIRVYFPHLSKDYDKYIEIYLDYGQFQIKSAFNIQELNKKTNLKKEEYNNLIYNYYTSDNYIKKQKSFYEGYNSLCSLLIDEGKKYN